MRWVRLEHFKYWSEKVRARFGWVVEVCAFLPLGKNHCVALIRRKPEATEKGVSDGTKQKLRK